MFRGCDVEQPEGGVPLAEVRGVPLVLGQARDQERDRQEGEDDQREQPHPEG